MLRLLKWIAFVFPLLQGLSGVLHGSIGYVTAGKVELILYGNQLKTVYGNNKRRQLTDVTVTQTVGTQNQPRASFDYNPVDHPLSLSGIRNASREIINGVERKVDYYYDPLNRLTREMVDPPDGDIEQVSYDSAPGYDDDGFDKVGNRRSRTAGLGLPAQSFTYNERDQISGGEFDSNGNCTERGSLVYGYDWENRLISVRNKTASEPHILIAYDGDGNRARKSVNGLTTHFLVDQLNPTGYAQTLQEKVGSDPATAAISREYVWGHRLISQTASGNTHYYIHDGHGSTRALVHGSTVTDTYDYDAFGNKLSSSSGTTDNHYRYTGEQWDADLGLYYLRARYYYPAEGRFLTLDTFEGDQNNPLTLHKYLYVHADPINNIDPSGHSLIGLANVTIANSWLRTTEAVKKHPFIAAAVLLAVTSFTPAGDALDSLPPNTPGPFDEIGRATRPLRYVRNHFLGRVVHRLAGGIDRGAPKIVHDSVPPSIKDRIAKGATNLDLMKEGLAPIGIDGRQINLHHTTGNEPGPVAEILGSLHGNRVLHGLIEDGRSFRNDPRLKRGFDEFRRLWWQWRAALIEVSEEQ